MKIYVKASYENQFWDLHDSGYDTGTKLEAIIDEKGMFDKFFPDDDSAPAADEDDYKEVLDVFYGTVHGPVPNTDTLLRDITDAVKFVDGVKSAYLEESIDAVRFTLADGSEYQLVLQELNL